MVKLANLQSVRVFKRDYLAGHADADGEAVYVVTDGPDGPELHRIEPTDAQLADRSFCPDLQPELTAAILRVLQPPKRRRKRKR